GFEIVKKLGHKVTELKPALVQLKTDKEAVKGMQGVKVDTKIDALYRNKIVAQEEGELLFTDYGISGNAIFYISYITALHDDLVFSVDFMPMYDYDVLLKMLEQRKSNLNYMTMENFLNGIINKKLGQFLIKKSGIEKLSYKVSDLTEIQLKKIVEILKSYKIEILGTTGFKNAQVTAGGIYLDEIDMETLESKKVKGLYFTGEIMDVFGDCGGYNLQWAWASGHFVGNEV
ncbi:MAG: aminoacetone oxidase family FAD-binding enzyme, partial [Leptotrichiaceae bacterium]